MPCKTYDLLVKVQPWEFGSSSTSRRCQGKPEALSFLTKVPLGG
jgi:hypothetical protein